MAVVLEEVGVWRVYVWLVVFEEVGVCRVYLWVVFEEVGVWRY